MATYQISYTTDEDTVDIPVIRTEDGKFLEKADDSYLEKLLKQGHTLEIWEFPEDAAITLFLHGHKELNVTEEEAERVYGVLFFGTKTGYSTNFRRSPYYEQNGRKMPVYCVYNGETVFTTDALLEQETFYSCTVPLLTFLYHEGLSQPQETDSAAEFVHATILLTQACGICRKHNLSSAAIKTGSDRFTAEEQELINQAAKYYAELPDKKTAA